MHLCPSSSHLLSGRMNPLAQNEDVTEIIDPLHVHNVSNSQEAGSNKEVIESSCQADSFYLSTATGHDLACYSNAQEFLCAHCHLNFSSLQMLLDHINIAPKEPGKPNNLDCTVKHSDCPNIQPVSTDRQPVCNLTGLSKQHASRSVNTSNTSAEQRYIVTYEAPNDHFLVAETDATPFQINHLGTSLHSALLSTVTNIPSSIVSDQPSSVEITHLPSSDIETRPSVASADVFDPPAQGSEFCLLSYTVEDHETGHSSRQTSDPANVSGYSDETTRLVYFGGEQESLPINKHLVSGSEDPSINIIYYHSLNRDVSLESVPAPAIDDESTSDVFQLISGTGSEQISAALARGHIFESSEINKLSPSGLSRSRVDIDYMEVEELLNQHGVKGSFCSSDSQALLDKSDSFSDNQFSLSDSHSPDPQNTGNSSASSFPPVKSRGNVFGRRRYVPINACDDPDKEALITKVSNALVTTLFHCRRCRQKFPSRSLLTNHKCQLVQTGDTNQCVMCNRNFPTAWQLRRHILTHTKSRTLQCSLCDARFAQSATLARHMITHLKSRSHKCADCGLLFSQKAMLVRHSNRMHCATQSKSPK
ncbi:unnamed protein product [Protopolystoma xenopodis]|uniref:C2H2-type domain-containing protein n=1 Tax=Protopolystoma xenopodis TaxID=117903 RepID=A0A448WAR4_9PLAT|nr:unnamed protein product [Protopolystoma xenopodis]